MQVKESKWLVKCFLNYLRNDKTEVNVLFDILSIFLFHTRIDFTFLKEFYIIEVCLDNVINFLYDYFLLHLKIDICCILFADPSFIKTFRWLKDMTRI